MAEHELYLRQVTSITQSPMNPLLWLLQLSCGHEKWVTRKKRPTVRITSCGECASEREGSRT